MAAFGQESPGKRERRKELSQICLMHPDIYVAQTTPSHINHFYKAVMEANAYPGPAVINVYTTCQPEHGVPDCNSARQAKLAVEARAFPLFIYDPRKGEKIRERLSLVGNPAQAIRKIRKAFLDAAASRGRSAAKLAPASRVGWAALTTKGRDHGGIQDLSCSVGFLPWI